MHRHPRPEAPEPVATARKPHPALAIAVAAAVLALALAWSFTPLAQLLDLHRAVELVHAWRDSPLAPLAVIALYIAAGLIVVPLTLLIGATILTMGIWPGALYAYAGALVSGTLMFAVGRVAGRELVDRWVARHVGSTLDSLDRLLERRGLMTIALIRLVPAPYSLINALAGASKMRYRDFVIGTAIGLTPVIALLSGFAAPLEAWLEQPEWPRLGLSLIALAVVVALLWMLRRVVTRRLG